VPYGMRATLVPYEPRHSEIGNQKVTYWSFEFLGMNDRPEVVFGSQIWEIVSSNGGNHSMAQRIQLTGLLLLVFCITVVAQAEDPSQRPDANATIERGLDFLVKDALAWKTEHNCVSCHHAGLVICALEEAKQFGHAVDEPVLAELTKWIATSGDGKFSLERPAEAPYAASPKAIYFSLALGANPQPTAEAQEGTKLLLKTVRSEQTQNGSWSTWPKTRPPIFGSSDESLTELAILALLPAAANGDMESQAARDKAVSWLTERTTDSELQSLSLRLVIWSRLARPAAECETLARQIQDRQNADGGWSQTKDLASDAWATGQALYALAHAGLTPENSSVARGQKFLITTQHEDGSWTMTSRPTEPGGKGSNSLIPITGGGSSWAVMGLVRSAGPTFNPQP